MKYKVVLSRMAEKAVKHIDHGDFKAISAEIDSLEENPWPEKSGSVVSARNQGQNYYKIRVRDYRIVYEVDDRKMIVYVERVARRNEKTYKNL